MIKNKLIVYLKKSIILDLFYFSNKKIVKIQNIKKLSIYSLCLFFVQEYCKKTTKEFRLTNDK
jgi:hypothetical protein